MQRRSPVDSRLAARALVDEFRPACSISLLLAGGGMLTPVCALLPPAMLAQPPERPA